MGSRGRQTRIQSGGHIYEFAAVEQRPPAELRTNKSALEAVTVVETIGVAACHGHKHAPLVARLPGFDWFRMSPPELMRSS